MGTNTYGLFRFDPKSHELRQFIPDDRDPKSIGSTNVADIAIDRDGSLWISSFGEGLSIMTDTERGIFQNYKKKDFELYALKNNTLTKVFSDNQGRVWIGTHGSGIQYYDQGKAPFDLYRENENNQLSISGNNITSSIKSNGLPVEIKSQHYSHILQMKAIQTVLTLTLLIAISRATDLD